MFCFSSMALRMRCASAAIFSVVDLRKRRTRLPLLWLFKWDEPHRLWDTFPVAEILNRFFIPLWVFSFGMVANSYANLTQSEGLSKGLQSAQVGLATAPAITDALH
jgi:hypothetical protein